MDFARRSKIKIYTDEHFDQDIKSFIDGVYEKYSYDFRNYAMASIKRRLTTVLKKYEFKSMSDLREKVLDDPNFFMSVLQFLTVPTTEMFRDPSYYLAVREKVLPILKTYPSIKIWIAGCSTGEEVYSFVIMLKEEGLLDRTTIYATDINPVSLKKAEDGVVSVDRIREYTPNYQKAGGKGNLSDYFIGQYDGVMLFDKNLKKNVVFADHSLATDSVFSEVQMVSCRNVLIYFTRDLQDRAFGLFRESLVRGGILGIGAKESLRFSNQSNYFSELAKEERIYQRK